MQTVDHVDAESEAKLLRSALECYSDEQARLRKIIKDVMQRLNESGTGEMGLLDTIHATHAILRAA